MKTEHTPGPWRIEDAGPNSGNIIRMEVCGPDMHKVCEIEDSTIDGASTMKRKNAKRDEANARLIAAAPDMFAALQFADEYLGSPAFVALHGPTASNRARAAIAKALGR